jgi:hypothetical protein
LLQQLLCQRCLQCQLPATAIAAAAAVLLLLGLWMKERLCTATGSQQQHSPL